MIEQHVHCRGCGHVLRAERQSVADGCICNSARGINHGLVPHETCTCIECDPAQTGSARPKITNVVLITDHKFRCQVRENECDGYCSSPCTVNGCGQYRSRHAMTQ